MKKFVVTAASFALCMAGAWTLGTMMGPSPDAEPASLQLRSVSRTGGSGELASGTFSESRSGVSHPVRHMWSYQGAPGTKVLVEILLRVTNETDGYLIAGPDYETLTQTVDYVGSVAHEDVDDFAQWVEDEYSLNWSSLEVDKDVDFTILTHTIETVE